LEFRKRASDLFAGILWLFGSNTALKYNGNIR
jgi:hypothetical protein